MSIIKWIYKVSCKMERNNPAGMLLYKKHKTRTYALVLQSTCTHITMNIKWKDTVRNRRIPKTRRKKEPGTMRTLRKQ